MRLTVAPALSPEERAALGTALQADLAAEFGPAGEQELIVLLHGESNTLQGGLVGATHWGWLYIRWLWVSEPIRGMGWGTELLYQAEEEAALRGCLGAYIDTFSPRTQRLYERCGYLSGGYWTIFHPASPADF